MGTLSRYMPFILVNVLVTITICIISIVLSARFQKQRTQEGQDTFSYISNIWIGTSKGIFGSLLWLWVPLLMIIAADAPVRQIIAASKPPLSY